MLKLTAQQVAALKPGPTIRRVKIDTGLQLRISTAGVKTWVVRYTINSKVRDYSLPKNYGITSDGAHMSLADAREEARRILALARQGIDFQLQAAEERAALERRAAEERAVRAEAEKQEQRENLTVSDLYDVWIRDGVRRQDDNAALKRSFGADVLPRIGACQVRQLSEHDVRALLRAIVSRNAIRTAIMVRDNLTQLFAWAEKRQPWRKLLIDGNPMDLIEIEKIIPTNYEPHRHRSCKRAFPTLSTPPKRN